MNKPKIIPDFPATELKYLTADSNYTVLHFRSGERLVSGYSLNVFAGLFDERHFIRIDRSHLVNRKFISGISEDGFIHLKNDLKLSIPRRRKALLFDQYPNLFMNLPTPLQP